ncbi:uncharacterized protein KGF55_002844 [Candida pseudojiufengensis]|uniref:uncharacterized protein n=1 Tax=Candida pseudojiufengensis TaxID=497109 RepID=UPI0022258CAD|nr:uncharacterized protein KGF55_002844 [Candida pseudojiufengensis]KAI5963052.1 hypothetical protein KGF55_002844 [Candida pseudojiufengensis]
MAATPQKKYICGFCAKAFTRSEHKQRHERSHTNEKPFHCLYCTSSFVRRDLLQRHCRTVHQNQNLTGVVPNFSNNNNNENNNSNDLSSRVSQPPQYSQQQQLPQQQQQFSSLPISGSSSHNSLNHHDSNNTLSPLTTAMTPANSTNSVNSESSFYHGNYGTPATNSYNNSSTVTSKKRRSSSDVQSRKTTESSSITSTNSDNSLINLLSITKKLKFILNLSSPTTANSYSNEIIYNSFLIGYTTLQEQEQNFLVIESILKDLIYYLSTYYIDPSVSQQTIPPPQPNLFKIGIIYSIISLGFIVNNNSIKSLEFFKKSWILLIKNLIPQYNNSNIPTDQIEISKNLCLLSYIYINYDLENYDINQVQDFESNQQTIYLNNQVILDYLDQISFIIISNLTEFSNPNEKLIDLNMNLFWSTFILLSFYLDRCPKIYSILLYKLVDSNQSLIELMQKFCKNSLIIENNEFLKNIIISTLTNELKNDLINSQTTTNNIQIYDIKNSLHNSIILINKSINYFENSITDDSHDNDKIFKIFKKNLIINCPLKYNELLNNYIFLPKNFYNWQLLLLILKENIMNINLDQFLKDQFSSNNQNQNHTNQSNEELNPNNDLNSFLIKFFDLKFYNIEIYNNLSIVSLPIIFLSDFLNLPYNLKNFKFKYNLIQIKIINHLILMWYLIMNKILIMLWYYENEKDQSINFLKFDENYILQTLIYLLLDDKSALSNYTSTTTATDSTTSTTLSDKNELFEFNAKWFWIIKENLKKIFKNWKSFLEIEISNKLNKNLNDNDNDFKFKKFLKLSNSINDFIDEYMTIVYNSYD